MRAEAIELAPHSPLVPALESEEAAERGNRDGDAEQRHAGAKAAAARVL
jgi:hypothetical protein